MARPLLNSYGTAYLDLHADPTIFELAVRAFAAGNSLRVVKARDHGRIVQVDSKVVFGDPQAMVEKLTSLPTSETTNTSSVKRHNLTQRQPLHPPWYNGSWLQSVHGEDSQGKVFAA